LNLCVCLQASTTSQVFEKYKNRCLIETGSYLGDGIQEALNAGFQQVHSIELSEKYYILCQKRFFSNPHVVIWFGDSATTLPLLLSQIHEPVTFWLDGHCSLGDTAKGETMTPILKELEAIKNHGIKTHTILIDDVRLFGTWEFDDTPLNQIIFKLKEINPDYSIVFEDGYQKEDVLVAHLPAQPQ
jgi:hypothetical protein